MRTILLLGLALALSACATREVGTVRPPVDAALAAVDPPSDRACTGGKTVFVTIDGTANTPVSRTAAARLHEMVEAYSYLPSAPKRGLAVWYAEGVGSADRDISGKALGTGVDDDIKKAFSFLTESWRPCDKLFLNGFSRGAYSVRALAGLLYMAGIPDLRDQAPKVRAAIVEDLFKAYKTRTYYRNVDEDLNDRRAKRVGAVYERYGLPRADSGDRAAGYSNADTRVAIEAITVWDSVQALGRPDGGEYPAEGPAHFLITACNVKALFQPLSLDDNRVYSFTPVLAGGERATEACSGTERRQNTGPHIEEVWFSGAHADVGGTYEVGGMLDGELASVSLNWVLERLSDACVGCRDALALPEDLQVPENRLTGIHDAKRTSVAYTFLFRQSRKPSVYWYHMYGAKRVAVHASVLDRLEWLFALDARTEGCRVRSEPPGKPLLCAKELASHSLVPELVKKGCVEATDWGFRLVAGQPCVEQVGTRVHETLAGLPDCNPGVGARVFDGWVYAGEVGTTDPRVVERERIDIPYPRCASGS